MAFLRFKWWIFPLPASNRPKPKHLKQTSSKDCPCLRTIGNAWVVQHRRKDTWVLRITWSTSSLHLTRVFKYTKFLWQLQVETWLMSKTMIKTKILQRVTFIHATNCIHGFFFFLSEKCFVDQCQMAFPIKCLYPVTLRETHWHNKMPFSALTGINQYICIHSSILSGNYTKMWSTKEKAERLRHNKGWVLRNRVVIYRFRVFFYYFCTVLSSIYYTSANTFELCFTNYASDFFLLRCLESIKT